MRVRGSALAVTVALAWGAPAASATAAPEAEGGATDFVPSLTLPIDLLTQLPVPEPDTAPSPTPPASDASPAERAFSAFQRGLYVSARELATPLAEGGDAAMQSLLGHLHAHGLGVKRDPKVALDWMLRAADSGDPGARHELAIRMIEGRGVAADREGGRLMLEELAGEGRHEAAHDLAQLLMSGEGDPRTRRQGLDHLRQAAEAGMTEARYALALLLIEVEGAATEGDTPDAREARREALRWMVAAARSGLSEAQLELGIWLVTGRAGRRDLEAAFLWIERAALGGSVLARNRLARMHWQGLGTAGNRVSAARWHMMAKMGGKGDAELDDMLTGLDEIERAQALDGLSPLALTLWPVRGRDKPLARIERKRRARLGGSGRSALPGVGGYDVPDTTRATIPATSRLQDGAAKRGRL